MENEQIFNAVIEIIRDYVKEPELLESADMKTSILGDLKVNSARLVDIIIRFEDDFDIEIDDDDADRIQTIGDAVSYISSKASSGQAIGKAV